MPEGADQRWTPPHAPQGTVRVMTELGKIARAEVGQLVMLPVAPEVLHRIEFRRVGRQLLDRQPAPLRGDELLDRVSAMRRQSVPYDHEPTRQMPQQMAEEIDYLGAADGAAIEPEVEIPPSDPGRRRHHLPGEVILQHRSLSAWRPGPHPMRTFAQSALVDEDDGSPLAERFFLSCGQRYFFQYRIACSSRSSARPVGRWQLQLSLRKMRQTWAS